MLSSRDKSWVPAGTRAPNILTPGKLSIENKFDDLPPEKLLLSYNRIILGAKKNTSNVAVHGELGEYPLYISAMGQAIKYLGHIIKSDNRSLLSNALTELINADFGWIHDLKVLLNKVNYFWDINDWLE